MKYTLQKEIVITLTPALDDLEILEEALDSYHELSVEGGTAHDSGEIQALYEIMRKLREEIWPGK